MYIRAAVTGVQSPVPSGIVFKTAGIVKIATKGSWVAIPSGVLSAGIVHDLHIEAIDLSACTAADIYFVYGERYGTPA